MKPKIRIVHIQTPEVIEIEPTDFLKFAQSLTGKSIGTNIKLPEPEIPIKHLPISSCEESSNTESEICFERLTLKTKDKATNPKKRNISRNKTTALVMTKGSHSIRKRSHTIVHTQTPEVLKIKPTDFQKLVQSLTGKSPGTKTELKKQEISSKETPIVLGDELSNEETEIFNDFRSCLECQNSSVTYERCEDISEESLIGVEELDKFINELIDFHSLA